MQMDWIPPFFAKIMKSQKLLIKDTKFNMKVGKQIYEILQN